MKRITFLIVSIIVLMGLQSFTAVIYVPSQIDVVKIDKKKMVERHNFYRKKVGVPPVVWSDELAVYADKWAKRLAQRCELKHRKKDDYGENIYWHSAKSAEYAAVDSWASEEEFFNHKKRTFKSNASGRYGHYTQIIWRKTERIGAAVRNCPGGGQIWVCNYDPPGNYIGEKVY